MTFINKGHFVLSDFSAYKVRASHSRFINKITQNYMQNKQHLGSEEGYQYIPVDDPSITFTTYDIGVSTAFLCAGFSLITINKQNPKKGLFVFEKADGIEAVADDYFANRLEVKARSYFDHLKALKNMLYAK